MDVLYRALYTPVVATLSDIRLEIRRRSVNFLTIMRIIPAFVCPCV